MAANTIAASADHRAYRAAALLRMFSVNQNSPQPYSARARSTGERGGRLDAAVLSSRPKVRPRWGFRWATPGSHSVTFLASLLRETYPAASPAASGVSAGNMPIFAAATLSRFVFFTKYMASSAKCNNPSLVFESAGYAASPTLGVTRISRPSFESHTVSRINLCKRRATLMALSFDV